MKNLFNSVVKGFGMTIGRNAANSITSRKRERVVRVSNSLTLWQGIKTILWFFPMFLLSLVINEIWDMIFLKDYLSNHKPNFTRISLWAIAFTCIIGYNYYQENKKNNTF
jgi:hypothetical protein